MIRQIQSINRRSAVKIAVLLIPLVIPFVFPQKYLIHILTICWLYALAAEGWDLCFGYAGLLNLGAVAFWGMAAYLTAFQYLWFGITPWVGIFTSSFIVAAFGVGVAYLTARTHGIYFALATMAIPNVLIPLFMWQYQITGGSYGLSIPWAGENPFLMQFRSPIYYYFIAFAFLIGLSILKLKFSQSKQGYYLRAIGEDEDAARSLGINPLKLRAIGMGISSFMIGMAGAIYFNFLHYVDPNEAFGWTLNIQFILATVLGGIGSVLGPIMGVLVLVPWSETVKTFLERAFGARFLGLHFVIYGIVLMVIVVLMPRGIYSKVKGRLQKWS